MIKLFGLMALMTLSSSVFAQTCYVDMVNRYNQVVRSYTSYDSNDGCKEGMKQCRYSIRTEPHLGGVDCIRYNGHGGPTPNPNPYPNPGPNPNPYPNPYPNPNPNPYPNPNPNPYPNPDYGYPYNLQIGEQVYNVSNGRYAEVISQDYQGKFVIRYRDNGAVGTGWSRNDLAPLRGCDRDICVNQKVFNTQNSRYATVVALQMSNKFILRYDDNGSSGSGWTRNELAVMQGCQANICVGQRVINVSNRRYARVVALQVNNKFVLKYEDNGATGKGWDLSDLAPIR